MNRRRFLAASGALAGSLALSRRSRAASPWGSGAAGEQALLLPEGVRAQRVLEVFLNGGFGPFESFYVVPEFGRPDDPQHPNQQWHLWAHQHDHWFRDQCGLPPDTWLTPFARDANGVQVYWGPNSQALRERPDVMARTRVLVRRHDSVIHVVAVPYTLTGRARGDTLMAGMGAHVQRHFLERDGGVRASPYSYVLIPENNDLLNVGRPLVATGLHPGSTRPLFLQVRPDSTMVEQLARTPLGADAPRFDALVDHYAARARARYVAGGVAARSPVLDDFEAELALVEGAPGLREILEPDLFVAGQTEVCDYVGVDPVGPLMRAGVRLLTHPTAPARHVTLVNNALGDDIWDCHFFHMEHHARNFPHTLRALLSQINEPGEGDPRKLDLDDTLIVISSEFGRSPYEQEGNIDGTNHWPHGYVTLLIGGPIGPEQGGLVGAIGPDALATHHVPVIDERAAILAAMGINPFEREAFNIGEVGGFSDPRDGIAYLNEVVLGRRT